MWIWKYDDVVIDLIAIYNRPLIRHCTQKSKLDLLRAYVIDKMGFVFVDKDENTKAKKILLILEHVVRVYIEELFLEEFSPGFVIFDILA